MSVFTIRETEKNLWEPPGTSENRTETLGGAQSLQRFPFRFPKWDRGMRLQMAVSLIQEEVE